MKYKAFILPVFILFLLVTGCGKPDTNTTDDAIDYGSYLEIDYSEGETLDQFDYIGVWVKNTSKFCFTFPYDYGIQLYKQDNDRWNEINNAGIYMSKEDRILKPNKDPLFSVDHITLLPDLLNIPIKEKTYFKAIINGHLCNQPEVTVSKEIFFHAMPK